jgi:phosphopantetheine--protein transferase-like protein
VGNDIVDLQRPGSIGKAAHDRFVERVFSPKEQETIHASVDPDRMLWLHWAAKEAAYKVACKFLTHPVFTHSRFEVTLQRHPASCASGCDCQQTLPARVSYNGVVVALNILLSHVAVHAYGAAVADGTAGRPEEVIAGMAAGEPGAQRGLGSLAVSFSAAELRSIHTRQSALVRLHAKAALARHLGLPPDRLQIIRPGSKGDWQPPRVFIDDQSADIDLSLSHHGAFVAWAFACRS